MKIIHFTDFHGRKLKNPDLLQAVDLVLISGDITDFGGEREAREVLEPFLDKNFLTLAVPGNCDNKDVNNYLAKNGMNIFGKIKEYREAIIGGLGGGNPSPFYTPQEYPENTIKEFTEKIKNLGDKGKKISILVTHTPPYNTKVDKVFLGKHIGSKIVRRFIEEKKLDLVLTGHIHEAKGVDKIGNTIIINPGPAPKHYAVIEIDGKNLKYSIF